jgi:hypothetical protein
MKIGDYIMKLTGATQYSPIFPRGGQGANFSVDVLDVPGGSAALTMTAEHKNSDDTGWAVVATFATITATGIASISASGIKEQLRFAYLVSGAGTTAATTFYINVLSPQWRP